MNSVPNLASQMRTAFSSMLWNTGSKLTRRLTDDLQHLGGRRLLLQRLGQFARARCHLVVKPFAFEAGTDPGAQQGRIEGLRQVVLGAQFDTANDAVDLIDGRNHDHWDVPQALLAFISASTS